MCVGICVIYIYMFMYIYIYIFRYVSVRLRKSRTPRNGMSQAHVRMLRNEGSLQLPQSSSFMFQSFRPRERGLPFLKLLFIRLYALDLMHDDSFGSSFSFEVGDCPANDSHLLSPCTVRVSQNGGALRWFLQAKAKGAHRLGLPLAPFARLA